MGEQGDTLDLRGKWRGAAGVSDISHLTAPTANQTQMRNTNTCTVAQNLYNWPNSSFLFFSSSVIHTHARSLGGGGGPRSVVIKEDAAVHRAVLLRNAEALGATKD